MNVRFAPLCTDTAWDEGFNATSVHGVHPPRIFHYLLKPIVKEELANAIEKAVAQNTEKLSEIKEITSGVVSGSPRKRFLVPWRDGFEIIRVEDVAFIKHEAGVVLLYRFNGESFPLEMSIDECETHLGTDMFFRANRQFIININSIKKLVNYWDRKMRIVLTDFPDGEILVSRDKSKALREWIDR